MRCVRFGLAFLAIILLPLAAAAFPPAGLERDAGAYRSRVQANRPPAEVPGQAAELRAALDTAVAEDRQADAVKLAERLIAVAPSDQEARLWLLLSGLWLQYQPPKPTPALQAAWLAYATASEQDVREAALARMADLFESQLDKPKEALDVLRRLAQDRPDDGDLAQRIARLRVVVGLQLERVRVDVESDSPRACFEFSDTLRDVPGRRYEDYVQVTPPVDLVAEASEQELCLEGFKHGASYRVTLREGLPASGDIVLRQTESHMVNVGDRAPSVAFRGDAFILPRKGPQTVPVTTVNVAGVAVKVYRINDRNVVPQLIDGRLFQPLNPYRARTLAENDGELVWQGDVEVESRRNAAVVTALPLEQALDGPKPGLYVLTARAVGVPSSNIPYTLATRWLMVSDLGLTSLSGADGVDVFVRALSTAEPLQGVPVDLVARNNADLGRVITDAQGRAHFGRTMTGGAGGRAPAAVMARSDDGSFAVLDLTRPAFDLTDRGVGGRDVPGPLDAYLYADRGVYRPGETVHVSVLLRDDQAAAVEGFPLTLRVRRPNGTVYRSQVAPSLAAGMSVLPLELNSSAPLGTWTVEALADPEASPVGRLQFQVEEFVPERLAVEVSGSAPALIPGKPFDLTVTGRFLYGPPAVGLGGSVQETVAADNDPYPQFKGYRFGLAQDRLAALSRTLPLPATDADGVSTLAITLPQLPDTSLPLKATFQVAVNEPGGRPTRESLTVPVRAHPYTIGIRPRFDDFRAAEGSDVAFDVIAVDADGNTIAEPGLVVDLIEETTVYQWYVRGGQYSYRTSLRNRSLRKGTLDVSAAKPAEQAFGALDYGRYRVEISDPKSGVATSVRFAVGWQVPAVAGDTPDKLTLAPEQTSYRVGDTARIRINPPFAGEALVTVATDRVVATRTLIVPAGGATVGLPVTADWGVGAYVTASVYRPPLPDRGHLPVRALGLVWLGVDPAERTLTVNLPDVTVARPRQALEVPVQVLGADGAPAEDAYVTLAAVDEGILQLTRFASPDPAAHYLGKRRLGVDIRDDYNRLITALTQPLGRIRQGGDQSLGASLPDVPLTIVSLFQGPVKVDAEGVARITLDIPDFNGELRLMAVAFDRRRVGSAAAPLTVRDPLVADMVLTRFLAPGDESRVTVSLHNVEAPAGEVRVAVSGEGAVRVADGERRVSLDQGARTSLIIPLSGVMPGRGVVHMAVSGPGGFAAERELALTVRSARPVLARYDARRLEPGAAADLGADLIAPYLEGTAEIRLTYSSGPPFDLAGLLAALDRYPYGCLEQLVSRGLPLLEVSDVERKVAAAGDDDATRKGRVDAAIGLVLDKQRYDGAFGLWSGNDAEEPWLTAYALEFLVRARDKGHTVPRAALTSGLNWLRDHAVDGGTGAADLASRAYAIYVLALAGVPTPGATRYFTDAFGGRLPTPLARGQLAAALYRLGDDARAAPLADLAVRRLARDFWYADYGSTERDAAALIRVLGDVDQLKGRLPALVDRLPAGKLTAENTNTQEQAWLVMAAATLMTSDAPLSLGVTGTTPAAGDPAFLLPTPAEMRAGVQVRNDGKGGIWQAVAVAGVPAEPLPAAREGLQIKRYFFDRRGEALNLDALRPGDVFVILLVGEATTKLTHQALVSHPLPAGWEIETARLDDAALEGMTWLGSVTPPKAVEARDDRYVAAVDLTPENATFRLAYLVRVVTPGTYELPGATIADMYRPHFFARQAMGQITIAPGD